MHVDGLVPKTNLIACPSHLTKGLSCNLRSAVCLGHLHRATFWLVGRTTVTPRINSWAHYLWQPVQNIRTCLWKEGELQKLMILSLCLQLIMRPGYLAMRYVHFLYPGIWGLKFTSVICTMPHSVVVGRTECKTKGWSLVILHLAPHGIYLPCTDCGINPSWPARDSRPRSKRRFISNLSF